MEKIIKVILEEGFNEITDEPNKVPYYTSARKVVEVYDDTIGWRVFVK